MSRSRKKSPHFAPCKGSGDSDKFDKKLAHRLFRRRTNTAIQQDNFDALPIKLDEVHSEWDFRSDGPKYYWRLAKPSDMRK
jgi:hypothetical protein